VTNIQDGHASDEEYAAVSTFFEGKDLVDLTIAIAQINAWNRLGIAFGAEWDPPQAKRDEAHEGKA
jgi:alkylhydroperoxidase family enzyme